jgi:hypothetical protein
MTKQNFTTSYTYVNYKKITNTLTNKEQLAVSHTTFHYKPDRSYSKYPQRSVLPDVAKYVPILPNPIEMWQQYGHAENS